MVMSTETISSPGPGGDHVAMKGPDDHLRSHDQDYHPIQVGHTCLDLNQIGPTADPSAQTCSQGQFYYTNCK